MKLLVALLKKEYILFIRDRKGFAGIFLFTALVTLLLYFGLGEFGLERELIIPNVVWLATIFGGTLQLNRTFDYEREESVMEGLKMVPDIAGNIYISKFLVNASALIVVMLFATLFSSILFNFGGPFSFLLPVFLGTISLSAVGTTFSSMFMQHHKKDIMLPTLFYPLIAPVVIAVIKAASLPTDAATGWLKIIIVFDVLYITVSYLVFDALLEE